MPVLSQIEKEEDDILKGLMKFERKVKNAHFKVGKLCCLKTKKGLISVLGFKENQFAITFNEDMFVVKLETLFRLVGKEEFSRKMLYVWCTPSGTNIGGEPDTYGPGFNDCRGNAFQVRQGYTCLGYVPKDDEKETIIFPVSHVYVQKDGTKLKLKISKFINDCSDSQLLRIFESNFV